MRNTMDGSVKSANNMKKIQNAREQLKNYSRIIIIIITISSRDEFESKSL